VKDSKTSPIETILCAFDFSDTARVALAQARWFAREHGARLILAHIVEPIPLGPYPILMAPGNDLAIRDIALERIKDLAASLASDELDLGIRVEMGEPGPQLIEVAADVDADLIVLGTQGLSGLKHLLIGSTAEYVVRRSACPVLTVHPSDRVLEGSIETVILPTDLSSDADFAVDAFIEIFGNAGRPQVVLAYADRTPPYLEPFRHEALLRLNAWTICDREYAPREDRPTNRAARVLSSPNGSAVASRRIALGTAKADRRYTYSCFSSCFSSAVASAGRRAVRTEQGARRRVRSATLPITTWESPANPCVPITIRSEPRRSAA